MFRQRIVLGLIAFLAQLSSVAEPAFTQRGYYMTFMRMPAFPQPQYDDWISGLRSAFAGRVQHLLDEQ